MTKLEQKIIRMSGQCRFDGCKEVSLSRLQSLVLDHLNEQSSDYLVHDLYRDTLGEMTEKLYQTDRYREELKQMLYEELRSSDDYLLDIIWPERTNAEKLPI